MSAVAMLRQEVRPAPQKAQDEFASLDRLGTVVTLKRDMVLFHEGDPAQYYFKVVQGAVRSCKLLRDGRRHVGDFYLPGDFIGLDAEAEYVFTAEAIADATLVRYARRSVEALAVQEPKIGRRLLHLACRSLNAAQQQMLLLSRKTAEERIATFLIGIADRKDGRQVSLPMTRTDIGDHLGLTMETVSRALAHLKSEGVIELKSSHDVRIRDREALAELAEAY
jgi:CRP/FNR family transcriptional regulator, nitrogen fixation regulation protein